MNVVTVSRIQGTFLGYAPGVVHRLDDGTEWEQVGRVEEYVYQEQPGCRARPAAGGVAWLGRGAGHRRVWPPPPPIREALLGRVIPTVMDRGAKVMDRILAIRDMGRVGQLLGADSLIDLLRDGDAALKEEVVWSLEAISGRVLGDDVEPWSSWWDGLPGRGIGASDSQRPGVEGQDSG